MQSNKEFSILLLGLILMIALISCDPDKRAKRNSPVLAEVFDHSLTLSELPEEIINNSSSLDSSALQNAFIDQWVRKMLLLHEAEKRKPKSLDIDKLVEDYKQSLLINNLEKQVIGEELDTLIKKTELEATYEKIKENFVQDYPIIRLQYIKIPEKAPRIDKFYEWWKNEETARMNNYIDRYAEMAIIGNHDWREWNDILHKIDEDVLKKYTFKSPRNVQKNIGEFEYFINIHEFVDKGEISPLSYIEDQISNIIIQKRKTSVMEEYLERLYVKEINKKNIVLHKK